MRLGQNRSVLNTSCYLTGMEETRLFRDDPDYRREVALDSRRSADLDADDGPVRALHSVA